ncbi:MAG: glycoside hydrolase family 52 protein [Firmicutes bacterium]|nr:glycoside hydrolase family 52 protein [Bacillota bacterium]
MPSNSYYVHHSPWGAYASFCLGRYGRGGGFVLSDVRPPEKNVYVGYARPGEPPRLLPFYHTEAGHRTGAEAFLGTSPEGAPRFLGQVQPFRPEEIHRSLTWAADTWTAGDLTFRLLTPFGPVPELDTLDPEEQRFFLAPAILAEIRFDNTRSAAPARVLFGLEGMRRVLSDTTGGALVGVAQGRAVAVACEPSPEVQEVLDWEIVLPALTGTPQVNRLGTEGGLVFTVPPGETRTYTLALATYQGGIVTTGIEASFAYTRLFRNVEEVAAFVLRHQERYRALAAERDRELEEVPLNQHRKFLLAHATHSYLANTELLVDETGRKFWVVNEGEYQMMNTLDLTVDHLFWELRYHPWTTRNVLDLFASRYSYVDRVKDRSGRSYPGGISFTHDMGVANAFSPPGHSVYERPDLTGCFSYMTFEELTNWVLSAALYGLRTGDNPWLQRSAEIFQKCLESLINRDRDGDGIMDVDSDRCGTGSEITTYDSLDASLGQARNNLYLAVKTWAAYVCLGHVFRRLGLAAEAQTAEDRAARVAATVAGRFDPAAGYIPAVFEDNNTSRIIPAIEGLVYPYFLGDRDAVSPEGRFGPLVRALRTHLETVLRPGVCIDPVSGGWRLSSTSDNTWMSKIAISQFVAERILGFDFGPAAEEWDRVHASWQQEGCALQAATDQIWSDSGADRGSRLYPRLVTAVLWLEPSQG